MRVITLTAVTGLALALSACAAPDTPETADGVANDSVVVYHADYPVYDTPEELLSSADLVVEGVITASSVREIDILLPPEEGLGPDADPAPGAADTEEEVLLVFTVHEVEVTSVLSGDADVGQSIEIKQLGGVLDGVEYVEEGAIALDPGEPHLLILSGIHDVPLSLINSHQGAYSVESNGDFEPLHAENQVLISENTIEETTE
ncbi:hypothetical protein NE857_27600 [Nocardiopsis exhalans]|uniref:DUF4382 domain-containing protein n=1 Tax=Nocardiopsis exhalans TaxID=163604 RepID=A0ABY5D6W7_9ACTN|nr:hypothetical protein [Nocardiopsis exhalans]USY18999.1 hypothetical protein NE857_27600 [Nocardiopsis exhalans]